MSPQRQDTPALLGAQDTHEAGPLWWGSDPDLSNPEPADPPWSAQTVSPKRQEHPALWWSSDHVSSEAGLLLHPSVGCSDFFPQEAGPQLSPLYDQTMGVGAL